MFIPYLMQKIVYWPFRFIFILLLHLKVKGQENCKNLKGPLIIASNHKDFIDGVLLVMCLPFWSKLFPVRSLVGRYYFVPGIHFFLKLSGNMYVAKAKDGNLEEALREPLESLKNKEVVAIYPEGRMVQRENVFEKGRRGISYLALKTNTPILPISIKGIAGASFKNFLLRRNKVLVSIGAPFFLPAILSYNDKDDLARGSNMVMDKIKELYYKA